MTWTALKHIRGFAPGMLAVLFALGLAQAVRASSPVSIVVSNVRDTSFTVSWLTAASEPGEVRLVGGATFADERGAGYAGGTHYVQITGLLPSTSYKYDLVSGGTVYDDGGIHFTVATGATLPPPTPDLIVGRVQDPDGSLASDTIVVITMQQEQGVSAPMSMLITARDNGFFHLNLSDVRQAQDPTRYFSYGTGTDMLTIQAADAQATGSIRVLPSDPRLHASDPAQTLVVQMSTGAQTPTLIVRLPTPTPIPATTPQETGTLVVGIAAAALVVIGLLVTAVLFVWRR